MHIVFGIGNPGPEYEATRHNLGFLVLDRLAGRCFGPVVRGRIGEQRVLLCKPQSYVNRCGPVLKALMEKERVPLGRVLAVTDDLALPLGRLRLRAQGSDGGHNGLRSILCALGSPGFARLRIGIGDPGELPAEVFVLQPFRGEERPRVAQAVDRAAGAVRTWLRKGTERAMSEVNRPDLDPAGDGP